MKNQSPAEDGVSCRIEDPEDVLLCHCMKISRTTLIAAIEAGATDLEQLMQHSKAGSGCGTCRVDLIHLLSEHGHRDG